MSVTSRNSRLIQPPACPACGESLPPKAQYCPGCGRAIAPLQSVSKSKDDSKMGPRTDQPLLSAVAPISETQTDLDDVGRFLPARYRPIKKLGQGGMGTVYQCLDQALERLVAIKIMTERYQADPQGEKRFMREARAQAIVNHPNMCTVLNFGVSPQGRLFLVMEYLEGEDIRTILRREKAVAPLLACEYLSQACEGLAEAHEAGLIHRDLKPSNIMIVRDHRGQPRVKILDLGLAKIIGGQTDLKSITVDTAGMLIGTPAYMSPEQVAGASVDGRADIYSIGVVFFEMLTGRLPFESETMEGWLYQHLHVKPPLPSQVKPELAKYAPLDHVVSWMMSKQPADRPKTADELAKLARKMVETKLVEEKPARKSGPRPALPFEQNPPARKSGPRGALFDGAPPPPPDAGGKLTIGIVASPPPHPRSAVAEEHERRQNEYLQFCKNAEEAESDGRWEVALETWQRALALAETPDTVRARIEGCRRELDFENQLASAGSAATAGDWERAEEILNRLTSLRPSDLRIEQARARLPNRLMSAWASMAKTRISPLPEGDLRSMLLERLGMAYAQSGDMQNALSTLQDSSRKTDSRVINLAHAIVAAVQNGHHEGMRPFLDRVIAAANGLPDPADRGRANLEAGRALTNYGDQAAAATAFQSALSAFSEANTKGIPLQVSAPRKGNTGSIRRMSVDAVKNLTGTISTTSLSAQRSVRASWENAVGVVAQAQADAGLVEDSLASAALIEDPWNLAQTLSQVAQALAKIGRCVEAERVAGQVTFALPKAQAYRAIAVARIYRGDLDGAEELLKNLSIPGDKAPVQGLLAAGWALRSQRGRAEVRITDAEKNLQEIVGARARFKAITQTCEPLLDAGFQDLAHNMLDEAGRLVDLIDDPAERMRSMLQLAQVRENARNAHAGAATRTIMITYQPSQALLDLLRGALVVWRQVRPGQDRFDCIERLAYSIGSAQAPALASEMLAACRDEAERALLYIGLISGLA